MELAEKDPDIIHLLADSGTGYDEMFKRNFPKKFHKYNQSPNLIYGKNRKNKKKNKIYPK